ncbi:MAG TPA: DNA-3-methyladenine glycosylase 2 family protein [Actinomycetota bacterium]|nr:DNA-3-methyladenine glycosylase 2 family protein [Actinomycetota bacterium]
MPREHISMIRPLTRRMLLSAVRALANADPALAASVERFGPPPLWAREPSYATLVHLVLEQQVSLSSARAAFDRLEVALAGAIEPRAFLELSDADLRAIGFSRQKAGYARDLAGALADGFDLEGLADLPDEEVRSSLMRLRGIGRWTADIYLIMCLRRPDVWPHGDQALATAARELLELPAQPTFDALELRARSWRPHRATAARILWHHYLSVRGRA